jgi:hypothetical protein
MALPLEAGMRVVVQVLVDRAQDDQEHKAEPHRLTPSSPS